MNILVTGGAGYVASHTAKVLAQRGHQPIALDNLSRGHKHAVRWGPLVVGDIGDYDLVRAVVREHALDAVLHFAALAYVGESVEHPRAYFTNNSVKTLRLLDALLDSGVTKMIFSSTCATYGHPDSNPITEGTPQRPINPYGESKLFVERVLSSYARAGLLRSVALRYFNAAGADPAGEIGEEHDPETHLIPLAIRAAQTGTPLSVFGTDYPTADGTAVRDYVHVTDLAVAHADALERMDEFEPFEAMNLGSGNGASVRQVLDSVARVTRHPVPVHDVARRPGDPPALVASADRAARLLQWRPKYGLDDIIATAWRWHTDSRRGPQNERTP